MNLIIPFTKDIEFKTNIAEICSISLEHNYTINETELLGNFEISGEYKTHEVSVNKESFEYVLPFSLSIDNNIDLESIEFSIEDFTYEITNDNTLKINIEYSVKGLEKKIEETEFERVEIEELENIIDNDSNEEEKENNSIEEEQEIVMNSKIAEEESFVTYNIHILKNNETIETICNLYNTSKPILENYNDLENLTNGDKLIIPTENE